MVFVLPAAVWIRFTPRIGINVEANANLYVVGKMTYHIFRGNVCNFHSCRGGGGSSVHVSEKERSLLHVVYEAAYKVLGVVLSFRERGDKIRDKPMPRNPPLD